MKREGGRLTLTPHGATSLARAIGMALLEKALKPGGLNVGWNHGWAAGQHVNHLHVHLIPRYAGDGGGGVQSLIRSSAKENLASVAAQIKTAR